MKEIRDIILDLKDDETRTKAQLLKELEPFLNKELEKLMREGELYFPEEDVVARIGSMKKKLKDKLSCECCGNDFSITNDCKHCIKEERVSLGRCLKCKTKKIFTLTEVNLCEYCIPEYEKVLLETKRPTIELWSEDKN